MRVVRTTTTKDVTYEDKKTGDIRTVTGVERHQWSVVEPPIFSQDRNWLLSRIPVMGVIGSVRRKPPGSGSEATTITVVRYGYRPCGG